jgi:hypothetical protein
MLAGRGRYPTEFRLDSNLADTAHVSSACAFARSMLTGGDGVAAEMEMVADLVVAGEEHCACRPGLTRFIGRSRRRVVWSEFSARLFGPLC